MSNGEASQPDPGLLGMFQDLQQGYQQQAGAPIKRAILKDDGTLDVHGISPEMYRTIEESLKMRQGLLAQQEQQNQRYGQQIGYLREHPLANVLSNVAAGLAQAPNMPGWVQGLGKANAALNPTANQLEMQQRGLQETLMHGYEGQGRMGMELANMSAQAQARALALKKDEQLEAERLQNNREQLIARYEGPLLQHRIPVDPEQFTKEAKALKMNDQEIAAHLKSFDQKLKWKTESIKEERQDAAAKALEVAKATAPLKIEVGQNLQDHASANRKEEAKIRESLQEKLVGKRQDMMEKRQVNVMLARMDAGRLKQLETLAPKEFAELENGRNMEQFADRMNELFGPGGKLEKYQGRWQGLLTAKLPSALSESERQVATHMFSVERKRIIDWAKAGVMGWRPSEDFIMKLGMIETLTPEARQGVLKEIKNQINIGRTSLTEAKPYAPWDAMPEVLGGGNSPVYQKAAARSRKFFDRVNEIRERAAGGGGGPTSTGVPDSSSAPSFDDFLNWSKNQKR